MKGAKYVAVCPHKRLAQRENGVDGGIDVVAVWV